MLARVDSIRLRLVRDMPDMCSMYFTPFELNLLFRDATLIFHLFGAIRPLLPELSGGSHALQVSSGHLRICQCRLAWFAVDVTCLGTCSAVEPRLLRSTR